jgi:hypothetical protein
VSGIRCYTTAFKTARKFPWMISNLMHKILIYLYIMHLLKSCACFEHYPAHLQELYVVTVHMQHLVSSLSAGDCPVYRLKKKLECFLNRCTRHSSAESDDTRGCIYRVSQEECARLQENVRYVKVHRYKPKHLYPKLNGYGCYGQRKVWSSCCSKYCTY